MLTHGGVHFFDISHTLFLTRPRPSMCLQDHSEKLSRLVDILRSEKALASGTGRVLVFVGSRRGADRLRGDLAQRVGAASAVVAIHGDLDQAEREQALSQFKSGTAPVLVATEVAARGLDILNVSLVVVYDFPPELLQVRVWEWRWGCLRGWRGEMRTARLSAPELEHGPALGASEVKALSFSSQFQLLCHLLLHLARKVSHPES